MNTSLLIFSVIGILLLFISMILSAMSARDIDKSEYSKAHKYATTSAVLSGLAGAALLVGLIWTAYGSRKQLAQMASGKLGQWGQ